ncbi:GNAT family N-acetyltransferase [Nocardioides sp. Soil805]|uniref:GNAT family N-acetyltransferase n=1 Tax=Nocardioides sp. Soil805 TaxID=1736416 RepID=UPI0007033AC5|nr:GNAT family N-acetyltransferase [Nocardioides sp. Soil805]KRF35168.1 hypothetical protein ASG94_13715 [Nocardioides sp. Soil805]
MAADPPSAWITTERLRLRRPVAGDARRYFEIHSDPRTFHHLPSAAMRDESEASARLDTWRRHWDEHGFGYAVVETTADAAVVGFAGLCHVRLADHDVLNLYYRFDPAHWGRGLATEAGRAVVDELVRRLPGHPVVARIARNNPSSIRVAERLGMQRDGLQDPDDPVPHWIYTTSPLEGRHPGAT